MGSLVQWKFLIDLALIGALGFLCFRFMRSPRSDGELRKVEGLLRELIQDAEQASRSLDSQLLRRRESLEQTLFELETVESRVSRTLSHAEQQRGELSGLMGSLTKIVSQQQHTDHSLDDSADSSPVKASVAENPMFDQPPEPPSFCLLYTSPSPRD